MKKRSFALWVLVLGMQGVWAQPEKLHPYQPQVQHSELPEPVTLPAVTGPSDVPASVGLQDALRLAKIFQSSLRGSEAGIRAAQGRTRQTGAGLNPRLSLNSTYNEQLINSLGGGGLSGVFSSGGWTHNATLSQLLFDFGHTRDVTDSQRKLTLSARFAYQQAESDLALQVKQTYFAILQSQRLIKVQQDALVNRREHVSEAQARFEAGLGLPSDVTRAETALSSALYDLSQAQTQMATDRVQFNLALGLDPRLPVALIPEEETLLEFQKAEELYDLALENRPEIQQYQSSLDSAEAALRAAYSQNAPSISTNLAYQNRANPSFQTLGLNLAISFDPMDGGVRDGKVEEAQATRDRAQADLEGIRQKVLAQVSVSYLHLKNADQKVASALTEEHNAGETLRLTQGRYKAGLGIFLDVLDAQSAELTAQTNWVNARTEVYLSRAALTRAVGK